MGTEGDSGKFGELLDRTKAAFEAAKDWSERLTALEEASMLMAAASSTEEKELLVDVLSSWARKETKWEVKKALADCLGKSKLYAAIPALDELKGDGNRWVRHAAERAGLYVRRITTQADKRQRRQEYAFRRTKDIGIKAYDAALDVAEDWYAELAGDMAHEINTVVTVLDGYLVELRKRLRSKDWIDEEVEFLIGRLRGRTDFFKRVVIGLGEYADREATFEKVVIAEILDQALEMARVKTRPRREKASCMCEMDVSRTLVVEGDREKLVRAFSNILANAIESLPDSDGRITVTGSACTPEQVEVRVEDNGRGIPADQIENVKKRFRSLRKKQGGVGLGLPIAIAIVEGIHAGSLDIESEKGRGTTVTVRLLKVRQMPEDR